MRYRVRWSNGFWKTFDSGAWADIEMHTTRAAADLAVAMKNSGATSWGAK
jgi:hypothetical protein